MADESSRSTPTVVTATEVVQLDGLDAWTFVLGFLQAEFRCTSFSDGSDLVAAIARAADGSDHHPDVDLRFPGIVMVRVQTHTVGGVTNLDVDLARAISDLAAEAGASVSDRAVQQMEIAIDTMDHERIWPFWAAALDYRYEERFEALVDPRGQGPTIWFQQLTEPRPVRNRIHFDITVPPSEADARVEAAVAAGGTLVSAERARAFWILADADGNEVCVCTWQDRD
ncbi:MAG: 4a-hydroxytetrahydrobiopterin dehydratase [Acidimicrobiia bacterium]|nr:4a-hydroxytetrahydrobiopterin dehydratase [Acidimicrobiia bacterium]